jgi:hypothetical protein
MFNLSIKYNRLGCWESKITSNNCQYLSWVSGIIYFQKFYSYYYGRATKTIWISVEYRLGPEYKYPIWLDDASEVTQHIIQNKTAYGILRFRQCLYSVHLFYLGVDETAKIGVAGDSAGGMISASLSRTIKGIDFQV